MILNMSWATQWGYSEALDYDYGIKAKRNAFHEPERRSSAFRSISSPVDASEIILAGIEAGLLK